MSAKVIWLTGISGAGKTTLGTKIAAFIKEQGKAVEFLDGNIVRSFFDDDLGFTKPERIAAIKRILFAAHVLVRHNVNVVVANIAPYYEVRDLIRRKLGSDYIQVYLKTDLTSVKKRDVHGHYKKFEKGEMTNLVGLDDSYDIPRQPDILCDTEKESVEESFSKICKLLTDRGV